MSYLSYKSVVSMKNLYICTILVLSCIAVSCRKEPLLADHPEFSGVWVAYEQRLTINTNGYAEYIDYWGSVDEGRVYGKARIEDDVISIKRCRLHIDEYPVYDTTNIAYDNARGNYLHMKMRLEGREYRKFEK